MLLVQSSFKISEHNDEYNILLYYELYFHNIDLMKIKNGRKKKIKHVERKAYTHKSFIINELKN